MICDPSSYLIFNTFEGASSSMNNLHHPHHTQASSSAVSKKKFSIKKLLLWFVILNILWLAGVIVYQMNKPLPEGVSFEGPVHHVEHVEFLADLTYPDPEAPDGTERYEQRIIKRMEQIVQEAEQFLVIDMFLFNHYEHANQTFPQVSKRFTNLLIKKKQANPDMDIVFITDEVNTNYNSHPNALLEQMKASGIRVVVTNVDPLRDSTPFYSAVWRTYFQWFGEQGTGWLPNLMATNGPDVTFRSYLKLLNVKANHRKLVASEQTAIVASANIHDASVYHSNIAFEVSGPIIGDILKTEQAAMDLSSAGKLPKYTPPDNPESGPIRVRYLTEGKIAKHAISLIEQSQPGDTLWMGMFYLADKAVKDALLEASERGVEIRIILDPNENAFGQKKIGIPNRPVAEELTEKSKGRIKIRWYNTTKEQYHTKLLYLERRSGDHMMLGGSANFTPRNLNDYNLENNLWIEAPSDSKIAADVSQYFKRLWSNEDGEFTLDLSAYEDPTTFWTGILYKIQYALGFTTF